MLDPFPSSPAWLRDAVGPWALYFNLPTITDHIHEVILAFVFYQFIHSYLSPWLSPVLFPQHYPNFNKRTKLNWDVHVVSLVQSTVVCAAALWVLFTDKERKEMNAGERIYGYTGACGLIQALATGYFIYDLYISLVYVKMFGLGMVLHGVSALWVFALGFRPFVNYYTPVFILYELSSPFLNMHWFFDKVNMTGGKAQWYNGMALLSVFFSCRLVWGTWRSVHVYSDMWQALSQTWSATASSASTLDPININAHVFQIRDGNLCVDEACAKAQAEISKYSHYNAAGTPTWLVVTYILSNIVLNSLNYYWFSKMIETVLKRFRGPAAAPAKKEEKEGVKEEEKDVVLDAAAKLEQEHDGLLLGEKQKSSVLNSSTPNLVEDLRKRKVGPVPS
ncbi:TLC domain-containing protein [Aspergillus ruber CBS 135680]|uniref:DUF887 domain protein n=1 Tax=Aspergillus ruber (strain CBS 135680) TaxID=1388766 RepID=A0A017SQW8_ASPRC|nr:DUF887 domain protein [Aspergillus ruber CBS 135680]EYE99378.1 DUF887 domain protein [Aspergillus ruber CBS 135680]